MSSGQNGNGISAGLPAYTAASSPEIEVSQHSSDNAKPDSVKQNSATKRRGRIDLASLRTTTMFEARDALQQNKDRPVGKWKVPEARHGFGRKVPRAATLFLGKDHDRWMQYEREKVNGGPVSTGYMRAWHHGGGTSSTIQVGTYSLSDGDEDDYDEDWDASDSEEGGHISTEEGSGFSGASSSVSSSRRGSELFPRRRASSSRGSKGQGSGVFFPKVKQTKDKDDSNKSSRRDSSTAGSVGGSSPHSSSPQRMRRFSSNGPEAAFLRHETVIGIHTPRRDSLASITSGYERVGLAPLSQIKTPVDSSVRRRSRTSSSSQDLNAKAKVKASLQHSPSSELLVQAANAAAAAVSDMARRRGSDKDAAMGSEEEQTSVPGIARRRQSASPRVALKLARRRKPIKVEGTLYDRSGPFREGAVTDGLCVRFFTAEDASENAGFASHAYPRGAAGAMARDIDSAVVDDEIVPATYLITTPDNRVSSAAKLRRWAMDGEGRFYAAMEIKSLEAKMRAADPQTNGGQVAKSAMRELRDRYLDDILDEVQKAETLNQNRNTVAKLLRTSDNKYIRLEEDYPEEAFFVVAGCDDAELYPVVALIFSQAIRHIVRFHSAGWLHGDIKLENLMFDDNGQLVVIDYENANPYRGVPGGDGRVTLMSYDWIPPEAYPGPHGRRAGPSADLWALGCNMVRAFALRGNVEDADIRSALLGKGQEAFLAYRRRVLLGRGSAQSSLSSRRPSGSSASRRGSDIGIPGSATRPLPTAADVDLTPLQMDDGGLESYADDDETHASFAHRAAIGPESHQPRKTGAALHQSPHTPSNAGPPSAGPSPSNLLKRFAHDAPDLLRLVLARCISDLPEERGIEAEMECLRFVEGLEAEERELGERSTLGIGRKAVRVAIDLSGSAWVRPKLEEARQGLGLA